LWLSNLNLNTYGEKTGGRKTAFSGLVKWYTHLSFIVCVKKHASAPGFCMIVCISQSESLPQELVSASGREKVSGPNGTADGF
jgi:hypothetical protein